MKHIIISSVLIALFSFSATVHAAPNTKTEEDLCFEILSENVQGSYGIDLSQVKKTAESGVDIDLSTYENFTDNLVKNDDGSEIFLAKRNNIGTIRANGEYIQSQFTGFGNLTNFTFPLKSENGNYENGDVYPDFRQNILYTHHLLDGTFVSCGYLKVIPKGVHHLLSVAQEDYKTNVFEGSGFELLDTSVTREGKNGEEEFLVGKVAVAAEDYGDDPLFKIQLITVAYNNKSAYFNEFETFPKQVAAMTNADAQQNGMSGVMNDFFEKVQEETCLELVHSDGNFPAMCGGGSKSLSFFQKLISLIFPVAQAKIAPVEGYEQKMEQARGMVIYDGLPYELYKKLQQIEDKNFKDAITLAILPNFEDMIEHKEKNGEAITEYEKIFSQCNMDYEQRMDNVIDLLKEIDLDKQIDYNNLEYLNTEFGDCVIPYPDKQNIGKDIKGSFASSTKKQIEQVKQNEKQKSVHPELLKLYEEERTLLGTYNETQAKLQARIDNGENLTLEEIEENKKYVADFTQKSAELRKRIIDLEQQQQGAVGTSGQADSKNSTDNADRIAGNVPNAGNGNTFMYVLIAFLLLAGSGLVYLGFKKKK